MKPSHRNYQRIESDSLLEHCSADRHGAAENRDLADAVIFVLSVTVIEYQSC